MRSMRVVQFYNANIDHGKKYTVDHFFAVGISKRTVYHILKKGVVGRATGTGRKSTIMTNRTLRNISRNLITQTVLANEKLPKIRMYAILYLQVFT